MESVIVYTGRDLRRMRDEGGCGHWTASAIRVEAAEYIVCVRNRREQWASMDYEHGTAFLVGKISRTKPSLHAARIIIGFEQFAIIHITHAWQLLAEGQRFPVAYLETDELFKRLKIDPKQLKWEPLSPQSTTPEIKTFQEAIKQAKQNIADIFGVTPEAVEITIRQ